MRESGVAVTRALLSAGEAIPEDLARAELDLVNASHEMQRASALRDLAIIRLAAAMGNPAVRIESLKGSLEAAIEVPGLEWISTQLNKHPAVRAADTAAEAQRARVVLAEAQRIPQFNLDLFYRRLQQSSLLIPGTAAGELLERLVQDPGVWLQGFLPGE